MSKWFGRDPAVLVAQIVSAVIAIVVLMPLQDNVAAAIGAVATAAGGLVVKFVVLRDGQLAAIIGFAKAGILLIVILGVDWSAAYQALLLVAIEQIASIFIVRDRVEAPINELGQRRRSIDVAA